MAEEEEHRAAFFETLKRDKLKQKPKKTLPDEDFWALIALLGFLYARCTVVAKGPAYYESVLADPKKTPQRA